MEYKPVPADSLNEGQRYYIVPTSRLLTNKLATRSTTRYSRIETNPIPIPAVKKNTILLLSAVLVSKGGGWSSEFTFNTFWNKDDESSKDTRKSTEEYKYFSFTPTPVPSVIGSTVTAEEVRATIGELAENVMPASMRTAEAGAGSAASAPVAPEVKTVMTPAVKKTTDELMEVLRLGEARVSISTILKRKNTPQLENLVNRLLTRNGAIQILPSDYPIPPNEYYGTRYVNVYSPYGAIELLIESQHFTPDQKDSYIHEFVLKGADPSKALVTAILYNNLRALNVLLDCGADPNYVSEYKSTDGRQRFLTSPLLAAIPARLLEVYNGWVHTRPILETLVQLRTFVLNADEVLIRMNRNSVPDGTPVYETVAYITPKILEAFDVRLQDHIRAASRSTHTDRTLISDARYTEVLEGWIEYLKEESVKQGALLAEPGGPMYEEARARAYGPAIGTRNEQLARNAAANAAVRASINNSRTSELGRKAEHGLVGGSRKHRKSSRRTRRNTRR